MIFGNKVVIMRLFMHPPELEVSTLLLFTLKEMGGVALMLAALLWFAARDPGRNVAIIDGFIVGFCVLAATPLISLATLPIAEIYPGRLVWGRSLIRLALAALFYVLRPRNVDAEAGKVWLGAGMCTENDGDDMEKIKIEQHTFMGSLWFAAWLFTIGFLHMSFWKEVLAVVLWPYYLGVNFSHLARWPRRKSDALYSVPCEWSSQKQQAHSGDDLPEGDNPVDADLGEH
jgi:hypothetical protein